MSFPAPKRLPYLLLISAVVFALDRWTKTWVSHHIAYGGAIPVIDHVLRITHWTNEGAAFSLFAYTARPEVVRWVLVAFASLAGIAVLIAMVRLGSRITVTTVALALILAGAAGNVHDRIRYGSVVDFIEVHIFGYHWPDFNVADSAVVTGACLLVLSSLKQGTREQGNESAKNGM
ncbi:MAG TPA: signal peptidase II [Terracidiphilus sp.]|nr:signal peptidase II [Terracidiphilus sp.]